ncbi:Zinc finger protein 316 [Portunus trituberculatus]|uniref:Zinc finger protein 316 n=1 Tax=Portunus trituberculatus TaxID=210409 RepID=A0A5B7CPQ8_PORTR|nr:Zinc finger protein 316 [Portunus trituberculatus]
MISSLVVILSLEITQQLNGSQFTQGEMSPGNSDQKTSNKGTVAQGKIHHCPYCAYRSNKTTNLYNHVRVHTGEKPFTCPHCPYRATQETTLKFHIRTHTGEKPYACDVCSYRSIKVGLNTDPVLTCASGAAAGARKSLTVATAAIKTHHCNYCPYTTTNYTHLLRHTHTHTGEKPFSCPHCPYRATTKENLKRHVLTHTGEKPYSCPYCPYRASQKERMKEHVYTHTGEKPYGCSMCSYRCSQKGNLKSHMLTHQAT